VSTQVSKYDVLLAKLQAAPKLAEPALHIPQHRQVEISAPWYTCFKCGHRFQFNIDGCPVCGGMAETIDCA